MLVLGPRVGGQPLPLDQGLGARVREREVARPHIGRVLDLRNRQRPLSTIHNPHRRSAKYLRQLPLSIEIRIIRLLEEGLVHVEVVVDHDDHLAQDVELGGVKVGRVGDGDVGVVDVEEVRAGEGGGALGEEDVAFAVLFVFVPFADGILTLVLEGASVSGEGEGESGDIGGGLTPSQCFMFM